jgi:hypothetical protein
MAAGKDDSLCSADYSVGALFLVRLAVGPYGMTISISIAGPDRLSKLLRVVSLSNGGQAAKQRGYLQSDFRFHDRENIKQKIKQQHA